MKEISIGHPILHRFATIISIFSVRFLYKNYRLPLLFTGINYPLLAILNPSLRGTMFSFLVTILFPKDVYHKNIELDLTILKSLHRSILTKYYSQMYFNSICYIQWIFSIFAPNLTLSLCPASNQVNIAFSCIKKWVNNLN